MGSMPLGVFDWGIILAVCFGCFLTLEIIKAVTIKVKKRT
jgi:hypothetical protein